MSGNRQMQNVSASQLMKMISESDVEAPYKLMITKSSVAKPDFFIGIVSLFKNGGEKHYDPRGNRYPISGDQKLYWCTGCGGVIDPGWHARDFAICPKCQSQWAPEDLTGEYLFKHDIDIAVKRLLVIYMQRPFCDIYMTHHRRTVRSHEITEAYGGVAEVDLNMEDQDRIVYPFISIMNDISSGGDLSVRLKDFLRL